MISKLSYILSFLVILVFLSGCSNSVEEKLVGSWKTVIDDRTTSYIEFTDERLVLKEEIDDQPTTTPYILTEREDNTFIIEIISNDSSESELLFEGEFEDKNRVSLINLSEENAALVKIKDMEAEREEVEEYEKQEEERRLAEEKEEEEKRKAEIKEQQKVEREKYKKEYEERMAKEEQEREETKKANQKEESDVDQDEELVDNSTKEVSNDGNKNDVQNAIEDENNKSLYVKYHDKFMEIQKQMNNEGTEIAGQDVPRGLYGSYYEDWDALLNEVWSVLESNMSTEDFSQLTAEQIEWIEYKENQFDSRDGQTAGQRETAYDELSYETMIRVEYLIENYMN